MPQSLCLLIVHLIFSTKDRVPCLTPEISRELHAYMATVARNADSECFRVNGMPDHVHLALRLSRTTSISALVSDLKTSTSAWLKTKSPALANFAWQRGYAAFSVGPADLPALLHYIDSQEDHHKKRDFQGELLALLTKYGVEHDPRYMWD